MSSYRLKPNRKHYVWRNGAPVQLEEGEEVELTEAQAAAFADRFEAVDSESVDEPEDDDDGVSSLNLTEVKDLVASTKSLNALTAIGDAEKAGKDRKGVYEAIEARVEELQGE